MTSDPINFPTTGTAYAPSVDEIMNLRRVAAGQEAPDMIVRGGKVLALHTGEVLERDVVVAGRHIAAITPVGHFDCDMVVDATGQYVAPTFIDVHIHIEYTKLVPGELARISIPRGTTTVLADANCMANVCGEPGLDYMGATSTPLKIFRQVSAKVPGAPDLGLNAQHLTPEQIIDRVQRPDAATFGESSPFDMDVESARKRAAAIAAGKRQTGHTALLENEPLWAYLAGGVSDDHNAHATRDVVERLRLGSVLTVMAGSMNDNTPEVFADIAALGDGLNHITFCADDKYCEDLDATGHIDHHVREAIKCGVEPMKAWRMATLNAALYYRLDHLIGSLTPSRIADIQIVPDLADARPSTVIVDGKVVARDGKPLFENTDPIPDFARNTVHLNPKLDASSFAVRSNASQVWVQAMEMYDGYFKRAFHAELPVIDGDVAFDIERDILKVAIIDRHHGTESVGIGFVRGFGLKRGAMAATTTCDNQNLVIVGTSNEEMSFAIEAINQIGGGLVAVADGEILGSVPLAVGGCMSDQPWETVRDQSLACNAAAADIGCTIQGPYMIMSFIGLTAVPDLGLTEQGLVEAKTQQFIDLILSENNGVVGCRCPSHAHLVHKLMDADSFNKSE
ncbi:amidohydrolase family protein [Hoeflea sp. WL0058]|uniref:Adenine deaminase n=1 Tax=Flavimaribacter sediminis TaxID=2865987 RepID=A0AAE2ZS19_9HYPH|nr:adenine deaminase C-terminal domain-containing protein [Flavimaribacter sediminis]MBW8639916.1 amidohydrolase family protein [Flavimaribacter sediminis]